MKRKYTPWYPGHIKPVRKGVYQRDYTWFNKNSVFRVRFAYWDGMRWGRASLIAKDAAHKERRHPPSQYQRFPWRGISK